MLVPRFKKIIIHDTSCQIEMKIVFKKHCKYDIIYMRDVVWMIILYLL